MKRLWVILLVIPLFAQITEKEIIIFNSGSELNGELISINLNQKINPNTGLSSEIIFKPYKIEDAPKVFVRGKINNGNFLIFDPKDVYLIQFKKQIALAEGGGTLLLYSNKKQLEYKNRAEVEKIINSFIKEQPTGSEKMQLAGKIYCYTTLALILFGGILFGLQSR